MKQPRMLAATPRSPAEPQGQTKGGQMKSYSTACPADIQQQTRSTHADAYASSGAGRSMPSTAAAAVPATPPTAGPTPAPTPASAAPAATPSQLSCGPTSCSSLNRPVPAVAGMGWQREHAERNMCLGDGQTAMRCRVPTAGALAVKHAAAQRPGAPALPTASSSTHPPSSPSLSRFHPRSDPCSKQQTDPCSQQQNVQI